MSTSREAVEEQIEGDAGEERGDSTGRLETLADGVFAIVMTLLVLELHIPHFEDADIQKLGLETLLGNTLRDYGGVLITYVLSFIILGVYWTGHRGQFQLIRRADLYLGWINIVFLMFISLVPFTAGLLGSYPDQRIAVIAYGINLFAVGTTHAAMWFYASRNHRLVDRTVPQSILDSVSIIASVPLLVYLAAILLALLGLPLLSIVLYAFVPVPYITGLAFRRFNR